MELAGCKITEAILSDIYQRSWN